MKKFPSSIYRLQLTKKFNLKKASKLLPYLKEMGFEGVYCSPYFKARSSHGYDILDPNALNPFIATEKEHEAFCKKAHALGLVHYADFVPNHMGIVGDNPWWLDVLKKGPMSRYAHFFDLDWSLGYILVPLLGDKETRYPESDFYKLVPPINATKQTSYRRFFNINDLIGLRMEDERVFNACHRLIFRLIREKKVDGLRIDHPDGLYDPKQYFDRLYNKHDVPIFVEKILGWDEELPSDWKVQGTVGYEFMNRLTGVFVKKSTTLTEVYERFIGKRVDFEQLLYEKKRLFMETEMAGEVENLAKSLDVASFHKRELIEGLYELLARFPIYRTYIRLKGKIPKRDIPYIEEALKSVKGNGAVINYLKKLFFLEIDTPCSRDFLMRFQQLSAPIMAKGFEDITLYNYNRLLALNEVGSSPQRHGVTIDEFHSFCIEKQKKWPLGFLSTSTHDTKRSHDVRMQLAPLSEIPEKWERALQLFSKLNEKHKTQVGAHLFPDRNAEYFFYQILLGVWPSKPSKARMWASFQKSIREARAFTSWNEPSELYETAAKDFVEAIMQKESPFLAAFKAFQKEIEEYGHWNSLSSIAIKLGCPGIVEVYEGCENWRYCLVDPDNRTLVNFNQKETIKSALHRVALNFRKEHKALFLEGAYIPLKVTGPKKDHILAYLRTHENEACLVAGARFFTNLKDFVGTKIHLPKDRGEGRQLFTEEVFSGQRLLARELFSAAPFAWVYWS